MPAHIQVGFTRISFRHKVWPRERGSVGFRLLLGWQHIRQHALVAGDEPQAVLGVDLHIVHGSGHAEAPQVLPAGVEDQDTAGIADQDAPVAVDRQALGVGELPFLVPLGAEAVEVGAFPVEDEHGLVGAAQQVHLPAAVQRQAAGGF